MKWHWMRDLKEVWEPSAGQWDEQATGRQAAMPVSGASVGLA